MAVPVLHCSGIETRYTMVKLEPTLLAVDTESTPSAPYMLSYSSRPGWGRVIMSSEFGRLAEFQGRIQSPQTPYTIVFHHALYDLAVLRRMGITIRPDQFTDTMVMAYLLRIEPLGLKALASRHCGMQMQDFLDLVRPHFNTLALAYLERAVKVEWPASEDELIQSKDGTYKIYKPQNVGRRLLSILKAYITAHPTKPVNLLHRWGLLSDGQRSAVVAKCGPFPELSIEHVPLDKSVYYSARDPDATLRVYHALMPRIKAQGLEKVLSIDLGAIPMLSAMQSHGIAVDLSHFAQLVPRIQADVDQKAEAFRKRFCSGKYLDLDSGDRLAEFFFGKLKLPMLKLTPTGKRGAVDEKTLELLRDRHPAVEAYLEYKDLWTQASFARRIPKHVASDGRIHCSINATRAETGRVLTSDPNMQGIPKHSPLGKEIRRGFIARPGCILMSVDLSQIELRVMAHESQDPVMLDAYRTGKDIHTITATRVFQDPESRQLGKKTNFLILYRGSAGRLSKEVALEGFDIPEPTCERIIRDWYALYPGVERYYARTLAQARRYSFVRDWAGRIRYVPNVHIRMGPLREAAEREACNFVIQGGAQEIEKLGMARLWQFILDNPDLDIRPLLQIHDELLLEVPEGSEYLAPIIREIMCQDSSWYSIPIDASVAAGPRWGDLTEVAV